MGISLRKVIDKFDDHKNDILFSVDKQEFSYRAFLTNRFEIFSKIGCDAEVLKIDDEKFYTILKYDINKLIVNNNSNELSIKYNINNEMTTLKKWNEFKMFSRDSSHRMLLIATDIEIESDNNLIIDYIKNRVSYRITVKGTVKIIKECNGIFIYEILPSKSGEIITIEDLDK